MNSVLENFADFKPEFFALILLEFRQMVEAGYQNYRHFIVPRVADAIDTIKNGRDPIASTFQ